MSDLSTDEKVKAILKSSDIMDAVRLLIALMDDLGLTEHVTTEYELDGQKYELKFTKKP